MRFEPVLDELFGVTNNKQSLRGIKYLDTSELEKEYGDHLDEELREDPKLWLRFHLSKLFSGNYKHIWNTIEGRNKNKRKLDGGGNIEDKSTKIASDEDKRQEWLNSLEGGQSGLSEEELTGLAEQKAHLKIDFDFGVWPGEQFFSIETRGETVVVVLNKKHSFYTELYEPLVEGEDSKLADAIDLLMMAYARTEDEMYSHEEELEEIRSKWGRYVQKFLKALKEEA